MNDDHKEGARAALSEAQHELERDKPDRNRVVTAIGKFAGQLVEAGKPVVTAVLMMAAQQQGWVPPANQ